jgi:hypothetical protein
MTMTRVERKTQHLVKTALGCHLKGVNRQEILAKLRENEAALRARGVSHAALFGSRARRRSTGQRHRHHDRI